MSGSMPAPMAVILCAPWPRSGSSSLFDAQARAYLAMDCDVAVVAVPQDRTHTAERHELWRALRADFRFDPRQSLFLNLSRERARPFGSRAYWSWLGRGRDSALAIEAAIASGSTFDSGFARLLDRRPVDVVHVNHCVNMGQASRIAAHSSRRHGRTPLVLLDTHDVQAERYTGCEIVNPFTGRLDAPERLARDELALCAGATALIHLSRREFDHFRARLPRKPHFLLRPTTRNEPPAPVTPRAGAPIDFLYVGNAHHANVRSIEWFLDQVMPRIDPRRIRVRIAGGIADHFQHAHPAVYAAHRSLWLNELGNVRELYAASRFAFVPMTRGSGVSIKVVEALAMGKFVVTSPMAAAAFDGIAGMELALNVADSAEAFAGAMTAMAARSETVNEVGRMLYMRHFSNAQYAAALSQVAARVRDGMAALAGIQPDHGRPEPPAHPL